MVILTAVDGERVPARAVETGYELARQFDEELVVLHVMPEATFDEYQESGGEREVVAPGLGSSVSYGRSETTSGGGSRQSSYTLQNGIDDAAGVARDVVEATLDEWENVTFEGAVGEPVREILKEADRRDARYLVVGGRKRTPVGKAVFGSVTQSVLLNADRPVVSVLFEEA